MFNLNLFKNIGVTLYLFIYLIIPHSATTQTLKVDFIKNLENSLNKRDLDAAYDNGTIYLKNDHEKEMNMADDIVHEVAHAVEERYEEIIYSDKELEREFIGKRKRLYSMLDSEIPDNLDIQSYLEIEYSVNFDNFLYYDVGYPLLRALTSELFNSPYAITSLNEYFANGFVAYHYDKAYKKLKDLSPILYNKIQTIDEEIKNEF